jgi:YfiH family protein
MKQVNHDGLSFFQFESESFQQVFHGFFTRKGGVSPNPWRSLNIGGTVGDLKENVIKNRKRIFDVIQKPVESIFDVWQVHSADVICTDSQRKLDEPHQKADAIFTDRLGITLVMRFADCVPIILIDPTKHVVGIVHAGWQGTVSRIVVNAIETIQKRYNVNPTDLIAGIGPSIGPDHYAVGENVYQAAYVAFKSDVDAFFSHSNGTQYFNLWAANSYLLRKMGVEKIESAEMCTACNLQDWYSHRAENGNTGRFACVVTLKE